MRLSFALPAGGTVGVVSPAGPVEMSRLEPGLAVLRARGFQVVLAPHVLDCDGHRAGTDADRAADLCSFFHNPAIDVLWCARGGSSSLRLWPLMDWKTLPPKMLVGFSDITSLFVPLTQITHAVCLHGPMIVHLAHEPAEVVDWQLGLLQNTDAAGRVPGEAAETLVTGVAEGVLRGGCVSLLAATCGTPFQLDARDSLLLLEDVDETPWHMERYLFQLAQAGVLAQAAGFIVGEATDADRADALPMRQLWAEALLPFGKPTALGFPFGHVSPHYALPLGVRARLDAGAGCLTLLEPAAH